MKTSLPIFAPLQRCRNGRKVVAPGRALASECSKRLLTRRNKDFFICVVYVDLNVVGHCWSIEKWQAKDIAFPLQVPLALEPGLAGLVLLRRNEFSDQFGATRVSAMLSGDSYH